MTNLEMLIKSDSDIRQRIIAVVVSEFCIDPVKMKAKRSCKCNECFFADLSSGGFNYCDENKIMEWLQQEQNVAERGLLKEGEKKDE